MTIKNFEFATATRIIFGTGSIDQVPNIAATLGHHVLMVASKSSGQAAGQLEEKLRAKRMAVVQHGVGGEPDVSIIEAGVKKAQANRCDCVISIGGGSVIDTGKAIAGLMTNFGNVMDYVEVVGRGQPITQPAAPFIAIPTTAGTGAEVTRNAVIAVNEKQVKVSLRSPYLLPRVAVVDPELSMSMPPEVTASTGLDAFTQLLEAYTCNRTNPFTDALAISGLSRGAQFLVPSYQEGTAEAREAMAYASLCSGMALANAGLGAVHGFAAVLGGRYPIPHGACCAALLPYVVQANLEALQARDDENPTLARYAAVADVIGAKSTSDLVEQLYNLCQTLRIRPLSAYGVESNAVPELVEQAQQASSMKANPIKLTDEELSQILMAAL